jgi:hypothetical protein
VIVRVACRCLPEQHAESKQVSVLVHTSLAPAEGFTAKDPAAHLPAQRHVAFKKGFHAVNENHRPVKEGSTVPRQGPFCFGSGSQKF